MQKSPLTIEEVANQFKIWRQSKKSKFDPIPLYLKDLIKQILPSYSRKQLIDHLGISRKIILSCGRTTTFSKKSSTTLNKNSPQDINFIPFQLVNDHTLSNSISAKQKNYS